MSKWYLLLSLAQNHGIYCSSEQVPFHELLLNEQRNLLFHVALPPTLSVNHRKPELDRSESEERTFYTGTTAIEELRPHCRTGHHSKYNRERGDLLPMVKMGVRGWKITEETSGVRGTQAKLTEQEFC